MEYKPNQSTLLRTLTRKSVIGFGEYKDLRVNDMIKTSKYGELRYLYFNCSQLSFTADVLDAINLPEQFRITKPGKNLDNHKACNEYNLAKMTPFMLDRFEKRRAKQAKLKLNKAIFETSFTKSELRRQNRREPF